MPAISGQGPAFDEHGSGFANGGGVAEAAENCTAAAMGGFQKGAAAFGIVAKDPDIATVVGEVNALVFDVELDGPQPLLLQVEAVGDGIFSGPPPESSDATGLSGRKFAG